MSEPTIDAVVIELASFRRSRIGSPYDATMIHSLAGLDANPAQHFTITGDNNLSDPQIDVLVAVLANDRELRVIEVTGKSGEKTTIYRGNLTACYWCQALRPQPTMPVTPHPTSGVPNDEGHTSRQAPADL